MDQQITVSTEGENLSLSSIQDNQASDSVFDLPPTESTPDWTIEDALRTYNIDRWGEGYFNVNKQGHLCVLPKKTTDGPVISVYEVIEEIKRVDIQFPVVLRFHDILRSQVATLNKTFRQAIEDAKFRGSYYGVFPIKVNQMREVVEEIVDAGAPYNFGLEAGSKPELLAVLAMNTNPYSLTILNGYKDLEFFKLALLGIKLGRRMIVVIEKFSELPQLVKLSKEMGIEPLIGIRAKLTTKGSGRWEKSSGDHAKFGLTISEIVSAVNYLKEEDYLKCLKLFHFHIGSQITDIRTIKDAITEGARIYCKLKKLGAPVEYFDVGGGLGIDYDGSRSASDSSRNYTLKDYCEDVIYILKQVCDLEDVDHPNVVSETGRSTTAHHSCVIFNVFGKVQPAATTFNVAKTTGEHVLVSNMRELYDELRPTNLQETYNDALSKKEEAINAFKLGILDLEERAKIETIFWKICHRIWEYSKNYEFAPEEIKDLELKLADQYLGNFSIFQSAIDSWGVDQLLPVVPIARLNERPGVLTTLADITCDSDGKMDRFIDFKDVRNTLPLHHINIGDEYFVGVFLTGAYQDIMGDMHNLFGRPNEVHIFCDDEDPNDFYIEEVIEGNTAEEILSTLQYSPQAMAQTLKKELDKLVARGKIKPREGVSWTDFYERSLKSYTYLQTGPRDVSPSNGLGVPGL